jgi:hypothetical protein
MPKTPRALAQMPPATSAALEHLGRDLAVARLRRKESLASWAGRIGISVPTLMRMESGDPGVGMGIYATALWFIGRHGALGELAAPEHDQAALEQEVRKAVAVGKARATTAAKTQLKRRRNKAAAGA